jgi:hypothetical protein
VVKNENGIKLVQTIKSFLLDLIGKKRALFQRIVDSYRLRVDDECVQTDELGKLCPYSIYGLRARGIRAVPLKHFRAYLRMGHRNRVLPDYLLPENGTVKYQALIYMATNDDWFNIGFATEENRIQAFYRLTGASDDSVESLRSFAVEVAGPICHSDDKQRHFMDYISDDDNDDEDDDETEIMTLTEQMHTALNYSYNDAID